MALVARGGAGVSVRVRYSGTLCRRTTSAGTYLCRWSVYDCAAGSPPCRHTPPSAIAAVLQPSPASRRRAVMALAYRFDVSVRPYTLRKGDTLDSIAQKRGARSQRAMCHAFSSPASPALLLQSRLPNLMSRTMCAPVC
jgi:hypothetical protein